MNAFIKCKVTFGENRICLKLGQVFLDWTEE